MQSLAEALARYRAQAVITAATTDAAVEALVKDEYLKRHETAVFYETLGTDATGTVYRLGTAILTVDIQPHLDALVTAEKITRLNFPNAYSCNPALR
jgi:hypothetical protein